jgi:hypothetical protein
VKSHSFIKRDHTFCTIKDHFIALEPAALGEQVVDERAPDSVLLKIGMYGNVFNMSDDTARMNELWFDEYGRSTRDTIIEQGDICADAGFQSMAVNFDGLLLCQFDRLERAQGVEKTSVEVCRIHQPDRDWEGFSGHRAIISMTERPSFSEMNDIGTKSRLFSAQDEFCQNDESHSTNVVASYHPVEMQFDFAVDNPPNSLDEATRFMVGLTLSFDQFQRRSREYREGALVNNLVSRVEFGNDKVDRRPIRQHSVLVRIFVRAETRERGEQTVMEIDDPACVSPAGARRQNSHVSGEHNIVDIVLIEDFDHSILIGLTSFIADQVPVDAELLGNSAATVAISEHYGCGGIQAFVPN